jgi:hypothetical protein
MSESKESKETSVTEDEIYVLLYRASRFRNFTYELSQLEKEGKLNGTVEVKGLFGEQGTSRPPCKCALLTQHSMPRGDFIKFQEKLAQLNSSFYDRFTVMESKNIPKGAPGPPGRSSKHKSISLSHNLHKELHEMLDDIEKNLKNCLSSKKENLIILRGIQGMRGPIGKVIECKCFYE